jgi:L-fuconolactonase
MQEIIDIHPHIVSGDETRYTRAPLSCLRPATVETLIAAMDRAGIAKAAVVQSAAYGFDNRYVVEACARHADRLVAVGSVDVLQPDAPQRIRDWVSAGLAGLRIVTGGANALDPRELDDERSFSAWELCGELGLPMCIRTAPVGLPQVQRLARRFPSVAIVLDHLARPELGDGMPYAKAQRLFDLASFDNVYLKLTPRIFGDVTRENASAETFFPAVVDAFGAQRLAWGSNFPASSGSLADSLETARAGLASLCDEDRSWIFGKTAQQLYPALA